MPRVGRVGTSDLPPLKRGTLSRMATVTFMFVAIPSHSYLAQHVGSNSPASDDSLRNFVSSEATFDSFEVE